jgi:pSer/pThr/pTyr-binding forkhead associated (FHA) protein
VSSRICYIGRDDTNQVTIDDEALSKRHAKIVYANGSFWIEDLASSNGTFVNGERVVSRSGLRDGDLLRLGLLILRFSFTEHTAAPEKPRAQESSLTQ